MLSEVTVEYKSLKAKIKFKIYQDDKIHWSLIIILFLYVFPIICVNDYV